MGKIRIICQIYSNCIRTVRIPTLIYRNVNKQSILGEEEINEKPMELPSEQIRGYENNE